MKKIATLFVVIVTAAIAFVSCDSNREPGKIYMPDMAYSRGYETYAERDSSAFTMSAEEHEIVHLSSSALILGRSGIF